MDRTELHTFPDNRIDALTMLYLSQQNLKSISPSDLVDLYNRVRKEIFEKFKSTH